MQLRRGVAPNRWSTYWLLGARSPDLSAGGRDLRSSHVVVAGTRGDPSAPAREAALNIAIIAAVFPIIFVGELPDKTMFASLVMSTRGRPLTVWLGAAAVFVVHVIIATTVGVALFHLVPHQVLDGIVALMFLAGAGLALREAATSHREEVLVEREAASAGAS